MPNTRKHLLLNLLPNTRKHCLSETSNQLFPYSILSCCGLVKLHLTARWIRCSDIYLFSNKWQIFVLVLTLVLVKNSLIAFGQLSKSSLGTTSICTALEDRQKKITLLLFVYSHSLPRNRTKVDNSSICNSFDSSNRSSGILAFNGLIVCYQDFFSNGQVPDWSQGIPYALGSSFVL